MKKKTKNEVPPEKSQKEIEYENLSSFFDQYISNGKLITKYATISGITRLPYIKGKDLKNFFTENFEDIKKEILNITNTDIGKEPDLNSLQKFYEINQQRGIFHYLKRIQGDKAKYPKQLLALKKSDDINLELNFNEKGFYSLNIKREKSNKTLIYLILLILIILLVVLFPIWPLKIKLLILYALIGITAFFIGLFIVSVIAALLGMMIGYDIIIMPNIDNNKLSLKQRFFSPFIQIEKREDPTWFKIVRFVMFISLTQMGIIAYLYPTIPKEVFSSMKDMIISWYNFLIQKVEDFHYQKNQVKVKEKYKLDDL